MKKIKMDGLEGCVLDYLITMHSWAPDYAEYVMSPDIQVLRMKAGVVILNDGDEVELSEDTIRWLLSIVPITFKLGGKDAGYTLKCKLFQSLLGYKVPEIKIQEVFDADQDHTENETEGSSSGEGRAVPTGEGMPAADGEDN